MKLLVIALNRVSDMTAAGISAAQLTRYFNPGGVADEVRILDLHGESPQDWPAGAPNPQPLPAHSGMSAWIASAERLFTKPAIEPGMVRAGMPELPASWLEAVRGFGPDLVRGYGAGWCGLLAAEFGKSLDVPSIASCHDVRGVAPETVQGVTQVIAVSEAAAAACIAAGARPADVVTISDRVDRDSFSPEGPKPEDAPQGEPRLLWVARDCAQKNSERVLEALGRVALRHPGLLLVHAGRSSRDWAKWPFARHFDSIRNEELPSWFRWADWALLPSQYEGFGIVLAEALSCGTPCITSNRAPMNDIVRDGVSGLTCDPDSVESISTTLERAITESGLRARLAANARAATEPFDIARVEQREAALYRWLCTRERPLISVVLPTYKRPHLIEQAIRNVLAQEYLKLELIVVNDNGSGESVPFLEQLANRLGDSRLRILHPEHGGLPRALNVGFSAAQGEFWTWTSDDNAYLPGAISALARELFLDPDAVMAFSDYRWVDEHGVPGKRVVAGPVEDLVARNTIGLCFMYRREAALKAGQYNPEVELAEDYEYWTRMQRVGKMIHLPRLLYEVGDQPDSLTRTRRDEVLAVTANVISSQKHDPRWRDSLRDHMTVLAGELKTRGLPWRSFKTAAQLIARFPFSKAGYWAAARAVTPMALLRFTRKLRGSGSQS